MNRTLSGDVRYSDGGLGISQCVWCRHRSVDGRRCRAFPKGIPEAITENRHDHRYPFDSDSGVRFEPEVVEIEFVDVPTEPQTIPLSAELAVAMARIGDAGPPPDTMEAVALEGPELELEEDLDGLGSVASG